MQHWKKLPHDSTSDLRIRITQTHWRNALPATNTVGRDGNSRDRRSVLRVRAGEIDFCIGAKTLTTNGYESAPVASTSSKSKSLALHHSALAAVCRTARADPFGIGNRTTDKKCG
jgi:hypothetical protein